MKMMMDQRFAYIILIGNVYRGSRDRDIELLPIFFNKNN